MSEFKESIVDVIEALSQKLTHEELYEFAKEFLEHVENLLDIDYETQSESDESDSDDSVGEVEELDYLITDEGHHQLK